MFKDQPLIIAVWLLYQSQQFSSVGHYGRMETAIALLNVAKARSAIFWDEITSQSNSLGATLDSFNNGETIATSNSDMGLSDRIALLNSAHSDYQQNKSDPGNQNLQHLYLGFLRVTRSDSVNGIKLKHNFAIEFIMRDNFLVF